jgi:hypothetical protein
VVWRMVRWLEVELKKHISIYLKQRNYGEQDFIPCEACKAEGKTVRACDIHHVSMKGMGGSKHKDCIENLIALCRGCHDHAHREPAFNDYLREIVTRRTVGT